MKKAIENYFKGSYRSFYEKYLPEVKSAGGDEYKSICPFHDEKNASFYFNDNSGKYFCQGCSKKGHIVHFYAKLHGLDTKRDYPKILKSIASDFGIPWKDRRFKIVKTYDYVNSTGELLFQVCKMKPKDFRQRRLDGNAQWIWNLKGVEPVLYRLPEIMAASEIIVVEGEKDADAVASLGLCATTSPMGAKKWKDIYNESLWGKHVVLIPDNDNEGREHMVQVAASLNGTAASLRILELPDLPSKGDFSDWLTKIGDKETAAERLALMIEQTALYDPPKRASFEDAILPETEFNIIELPTRKDILRPWLKEQSNSLVPGWRGVGKTWCAMGIVNAVTINEPFGPWDAGEPVPCLYLEGEMPAETVRERFRELRNDAERKAPLYIYSDAYANHLGLPRANLLNESWRKKMKSILLARHVKLWVIDNLASLASGIDENSKRDWDPINAWLLELRFAGIATIMLHHTNKMGSQRGTSAREDNIDSSILLRHPPDYTPEDGARFIATFKKARVHTEDLSLIADTEFQLTQDENNQFVWTWGSVKGQTKAEVLRLLDEGHPQNEVADILRIHKGTVSKIRKHAISDGLLTPKNKLTHRGFAMVSEDGD